MRLYLLSSVAVLAAAPALAGGVERSNQSMAILFEQGNYLEFGASYTRPRVSGESAAGVSSGNMSEDFFALDLRFRGQVNDQLSYAIIIDEPIGANVAYPTGTGYPIAGSTGTIESRALTGVVRYAFDGGVSVYGGLRAVRTRGEVELTLPTVLGPQDYTMSTNTDTAYGYLLGVAYEMPEIAGRVSLTYNSQVSHDFDSTETFSLPVGPIPPGTDIPGSFTTTIPESLHLEFQTGIMEDTLLFGGVRWVRWSKFDITPQVYEGITGDSLVEYNKPTTTYTLGVGRRFTEQLSGSASISHERQSGGQLGNLGPTDGFTSVGLGASYTVDNITVSGGVQYRWIGGGDTSVGSFSGNSATSAGLRVGVRF
ncbi:MAG: hypothetical protein EA386_01670 [Rhodobacteraceae bacterium]|nr:MAG: hypothetical protein EA386_01670 [Paracoccaceae bacterium]